MSGFQLGLGRYNCFGSQSLGQSESCISVHVFFSNQVMVELIFLSSGMSWCRDKI